jgi:hypothetical protein
MSIKRIDQFPEGSGSLTTDDVFLFMDDPAASGATKKISLADLSAAIGGGSVSGGDFVKYDYSTTAGSIGGTNSVLGINSDGGNFAFDGSLGIGYDGGLASTIAIDPTTGIISGFVENGVYQFDASFFYKRDSASSAFDRDFYLSMEFKSGSNSYSTLDEYYDALFQGSTLNNSLYYFTAKLNGIMKFLGPDSTQRIIRISQSPDITSDLYIDYGYFSITRIA